MTEAITFTICEEVVTVDRFPEEIQVAAEFLGAVDPALARVDGDRLIFTAANGEATYLRVGPGSWPRSFHYTRLYASDGMA